MFCAGRRHKNGAAALSAYKHTGKYFGPNYIIHLKSCGNPLPSRSIYTSRVLFGGRDRRHSTQII